MPKKKKTRKQKTLADVRRQKEPKVTNTAFAESKPQTRENVVAPSTPDEMQPPSRTSKRIVQTSDYHYLARDLRKTILLTTSIIVIELAIKFGTGI